MGSDSKRNAPIIYSRNIADVERAYKHMAGAESVFSDIEIEYSSIRQDLAEAIINANASGVRWGDQTYVLTDAPVLDVDSDKKSELLKRLIEHGYGEDVIHAFYDMDQEREHELIGKICKDNNDHFPGWASKCGQITLEENYVHENNLEKPYGMCIDMREWNERTLIPAWEVKGSEFIEQMRKELKADRIKAMGRALKVIQDAKNFANLFEGDLYSVMEDAGVDCVYAKNWRDSSYGNPRYDVYRRERYLRGYFNFNENPKLMMPLLEHGYGEAIYDAIPKESIVEVLDLVCEDGELPDWLSDVVKYRYNRDVKKLANSECEVDDPDDILDLSQYTNGYYSEDEVALDRERRAEEAVWHYADLLRASDRYAQRKAELIKYMSENNVGMIIENGIKISIDHKLISTIKGGYECEVLKRLRANGYTSQDTIQDTAMESLLFKIYHENGDTIPKWLSDIVTVDVQYDLLREYCCNQE